MKAVRARKKSLPGIQPVNRDVGRVRAGVMSSRQDRGARSGKRTRYDQRRGYDPASGQGGRQLGGGGSGRYSGSGHGQDTPPRFAHRHHRNSDSRDGGYYYDDGGGGGERGGGRRGGYSGKGRYDREWGGGGGGRGSVPKSTYGEKLFIQSVKCILDKHRIT